MQTIERPPMRVPVVIPRIYHLEFLCDGLTIHWTGAALSRFEAENNARAFLAEFEADFRSDRACLMRAEVQS